MPAASPSSTTGPSGDRDILRTARLHLRRFRPDDAAAMHAILADPLVMRFWSTPPHDSFSQTREWIASTIAAVAAGKADDFAVLRDGVLIGKVGLWQGSEIGFMFASSTWGQGFGGEAVEAVCRHSFDRGREIITADVDPRNEVSLRLLARLGFRETGRAEGTFRIDGVWVDSIYLACLPPETRAR